MTPSASNYALRVTAGTEYTSHEPVPVNTNKAVHLSTADASISLSVHIKDYRAPTSSSSTAGTTSSSYFSSSRRSGTRYSIAFTFVPKRDVPANDLVFGNDFDAPIRALLPPFFGSALGVVKSAIDPGIDGDPYAEKPYLYGPLVSSANCLRFEGKAGEADKGGEEEEEPLEEGALDEEAEKERKALGMPDDAGKRMKWFLNEEKRKNWTLKKGHTYKFDFYNGYLDFNDFSLRLPMGFSFNILRLAGDKEVPPLRYVLRDRATDTVLFHVTLNLHPKDEDEKSSTSESKEETRGPVDNKPDTTEVDVD